VIDQESQSLLRGKPGNEVGGFQIFLGGRSVGELQMIDLRFPGQEICLVTCRLFAQLSRPGAAFGQHVARTFEIALIDQGLAALSERRELDWSLLELLNLFAKLEELIGLRIEPLRDRLVRDPSLTELEQYRAQRSGRYALIARNLGN
jgi:hypothetical protein